jgi:hypothetical protein
MPSAGTARRDQAREWRGWFAGTSWDRSSSRSSRLAVGPRHGPPRGRGARTRGGPGRPGRAAGVRHTRARNNPIPNGGRLTRDGAMFNSLDSPANPRTLQAATRALGWLQDTNAVPLLADTARPAQRSRHGQPVPGGGRRRSAGPDRHARRRNGADPGLRRAPRLLHHTRWYGDHDALIACHSAPVHYLITEALDRMGSTKAAGIVPHLIRSVPTDPDRALFPATMTTRR